MSGMVCHFCGQPVDPDEAGAYRLVEAWISNTPEGERSEIVVDSLPQGYAHASCLAQATSRGSSAEAR